MAMSKNKAVTGIVIPREIKEQLEKFAKQERRSLPNYISVVLENHVRQKMKARVNNDFLSL